MDDVKDDTDFQRGLFSMRNYLWTLWVILNDSIINLAQNMVIEI